VETLNNADAFFILIIDALPLLLGKHMTFMTPVLKFKHFFRSLSLPGSTACFLQYSHPINRMNFEVNVP
jgi:hypothetical protein